jgi:hypothetical protein
MQADWNIEYVRARNWPDSLVSVCQFENGHCHIVVHRDCWAVVSRGLILDRVFSEAVALLKRLPDAPRDYAPYSAFTSGRKLGVAR